MRQCCINRAGSPVYTYTMMPRLKGLSDCRCAWLLQFCGPLILATWTHMPCCRFCASARSSFRGQRAQSSGKTTLSGTLKAWLCVLTHCFLQASSAFRLLCHRTGACLLRQQLRQQRQQPHRPHKVPSLVDTGSPLALAQQGQCHTRAERVDPQSAPAPSSYAWADQWYPVSFCADLEVGRPAQVWLFDEPIVILRRPGVLVLRAARLPPWHMDVSRAASVAVRAEPSST